MKISFSSVELCDLRGKNSFWTNLEKNYIYGGIAQLVEQTAHIRSVIGPSPIAAIFFYFGPNTRTVSAPELFAP